MDVDRRKSSVNLLWLLIGCVLMVFVGLRWNLVFTAWVAPIFLIRFFRGSRRWYWALIAFPALTVSVFFSIHGGWDMEVGTEVMLTIFRTIPLMLVLFLDRWLSKKMSGVVRTLIYPVFLVPIDYLMDLIPTVSTTFNFSGSLFAMAPFIQMTSITGLWGILFIVSWFASVANSIWEGGSELSAWKKPAAVFAVCLVAILGYGAVRISIGNNRKSPTVKVASVAVEHRRDYWGEIIDRETPPQTTAEFGPELRELEESLFEHSRVAVAGGARIVFWAEGNCVLYEDQQDAFLGRAKAFAVENEIYFMPAMVVMRYGQVLNDNKCVMIDPQGSIAFHYVKTWSYYPTESDGIVRHVDTPFGRLSAAICFDMDFPVWLRRQTRKQNVDIMLVPAYDIDAISPWHTEIALFRAIENGFSVFRGCNEGASIAVDGYGKVLVYQDFFRTNPRIAYADIPIEGAKTLYGVSGDWLIALCAIGAVYITIMALVRRRRSSS